MKIYTSDEIFQLIRNITDISDIQRISDYLTENSGVYSCNELWCFNQVMVIYMDQYL